MSTDVVDHMHWNCCFFISEKEELSKRSLSSTQHPRYLKTECKENDSTFDSFRSKDLLGIKSAKDSFCRACDRRGWWQEGQKEGLVLLLRFCLFFIVLLIFVLSKVVPTQCVCSQDRQAGKQRGFIVYTPQLRPWPWKFHENPWA